MRGLTRPLFVLFVTTVAMPVTVFAQGAITGTVRDTSGAVLPGVTVETSSPVAESRRVQRDQFERRADPEQQLRDVARADRHP